VVRYALTPRARDGLLGILRDVERDFDAFQALRVFDRIVAGFVLLAEHPGVGHVRSDLHRDPGVRFWSVPPSLIAYRVAPDGVLEILMVERAERDWPRLLGET
jgi:plasmid stabilization system protein ParE